MIILISWAISHILLSYKIVNDNNNNYLTLLISILLIIAYTFKPTTFDLITYYKYFDDPVSLEFELFEHEVEYSFHLISSILDYLELSPGYIFIIYVILITIPLYFCYFIINKKNSFSAILIISASIFYLIATQNILRQGISLSYLILSIIILVYTKNYFLSFLLAVLSYSFHRFQIPFLFISLVFAALFLYRDKFKNSICVIYLIGLSIGISILIYTESIGGIYANSSLELGSYRTSSSLKFLAISIIFIISNILLYKNKLDENINFIVTFRNFVYILLLPLSFGGEVFSRIAVFYFLVECILIISIFNHKTYKNRLACAIIIISYGFAPNAWNILSDSRINILSLMADTFYSPT